MHATVLKQKNCLFQNEMFYIIGFYVMMHEWLNVANVTAGKAGADFERLMCRQLVDHSNIIY